MIELLVVISIIALLIAILMPALNRAREQAKAAQCMSNLKQLTTAMALYSENYDGAIMGMGHGPKRWFRQLAPYLGDRSFKDNPNEEKGTKGVMQIGICPSTKLCKITLGESTPGTDKTTWYVSNPEDDKGGDGYGMYASYGVNSWLLENVYGYSDTYPTIARKEYYYSYKSYLSLPSGVPVLGDCIWVNSWPAPSDLPPNDLHAGNGINYSDTGRFCIDRHNMAVNVAFTDTRVQKVPLEELWTLKWHKKFRPRFDVVIPRN